MTSTPLIKAKATATACLLVLISVFIAGSTPFLPGQEEAPKTDGVRTVYLIRHGEYDQEDERDPDVGRGLVPLGIAQSRLIAARLRGLPVKMTSLTSSTMTRARETAQVIQRDFPELTLGQSRLIRECTPPTWRRDIMEGADPVRFIQCKTRLDEAFGTFLAPSPDMDRHDIVVCHGNVIRYFVTRVLRVNDMAWLGMSVTNCGLTTVRIYPNGAMVLLGFNDAGHIPPNMQTATSDENSAARLLLDAEGRQLGS